LVTYQQQNVTYFFLPAQDFLQENKKVLSQNTFYYCIKIVRLFPYQSFITIVTFSRMRKQWELGSLYFKYLTKIYTHTDNRQTYSSVHLNLYGFGRQTGRQKLLH